MHIIQLWNFTCDLSRMLRVGILKCDVISISMSQVFFSADPPVIVHVHNFTIYDLEQSAILECVIRNLEHDLKVWTNWTTSEGKMITKKHVMFPKGNAYYLVVYNATAEDFTCQVFSTHSPDTPEDSKVVSVLMSGQQIL